MHATRAASAARPRLTGALVAALVALIAVASGCGGTYRAQPSASLHAHARWALLPVTNLTETPMAGEKVEAILGTLLRARGVGELTTYPEPSGDDDALPELDDRRRVEAARAWAKAQGFDYGVTGTVHEWRYKTGLDGEPAVGVALEVIDLHGGAVVWSATGANTGWGRESLSATGQQVVERLLRDLPVR